MYIQLPLAWFFIFLYYGLQHIFSVRTKTQTFPNSSWEDSEILLQAWVAARPKNDSVESSSTGWLSRHVALRSPVYSCWWGSGNSRLPSVSGIISMWNVL